MTDDVLAECYHLLRERGRLARIRGQKKAAGRDSAAAASGSSAEKDALCYFDATTAGRGAQEVQS